MNSYQVAFYDGSYTHINANSEADVNRCFGIENIKSIHRLDVWHIK